jgi:hypothetical protein
LTPQAKLPSTYACVTNYTIGCDTCRAMPRKNRPNKMCCKCGIVGHYKCAGCTYGKRVRYCGVVCQKAHWGRHQVTCPRDDTTVACKIQCEAVTVAELATMQRVLDSIASLGQDSDTVWEAMKDRIPGGYRGQQPLAEWDEMKQRQKILWAAKFMNSLKAPDSSTVSKVAAPAPVSQLAGYFSSAKASASSSSSSCLSSSSSSSSSSSLRQVANAPSDLVAPGFPPQQSAQLPSSAATVATSGSTSFLLQRLHKFGQSNLAGFPPQQTAVPSSASAASDQWVPSYVQALPTCTEKVLSLQDPRTGEVHHGCRVLVPGARTVVTTFRRGSFVDGVFKLCGISEIVDEEFTLCSSSVAGILGDLTILLRTKISFLRAVRPCASMSCSLLVAATHNTFADAAAVASNARRGLQAGKGRVWTDGAPVPLLREGVVCSYPTCNLSRPQEL